MKYLLLLVILIFGALSLNAQNVDTIEQYLNYDMKKCEPANATYFRMAIKEGQWWKVKDFYIKEQVKKYDGYFVKYDHDTFSYKQGMHTEYHENGRIRNKVRYLNNLREGLYKAYDTGGRITDSVLFKNNLPNKYGYGWYSDGKVRMKGVYDTDTTGIGEEWEYHPNGKLASYGKLAKGYLSDSVWTYYHENGNISSIETYSKDSLLSITCYNEDGTISKDSCVSMIIPKPLFDINTFLNENLIYPQDALDNSVQGMVLVEFTVKIDGTINNISTSRRLVGGGCEEEAIRVIKLMPKWKPAKHHGKLIDFKYILPITFKLG